LVPLPTIVAIHDATSNDSPSSSTKPTPTMPTIGGNDTLKFLLCKTRDENPGFPIPESDPDFLTGTPQYATIPDAELKERFSTLQSSFKAVEVANTFLAGVAEAAKWKNLAKAFAISGPVFAAVSVAMSFFVSDSDAVLKQIDSQFAQLNENLEKLTQKVLDAIQDVRKDLAEITLDDAIVDLQTIDFAYKDMVYAYNNSEDIEVQRYYSEKYR